MVSIRDNDGFAFCGATLLTPYYAVTAAHCKEFAKLKYYKVTAGHMQRYYRQSMEEKGFQERKLVMFENHPRYDSLELANDLAMLKVDRPFQFTDYVKPACLVPENFQFNERVECLISGWGNTARHDRPDDYMDTMQKAIVSYFSPTQCNAKNQ